MRLEVFGFRTAALDLEDSGASPELRPLMLHRLEFGANLNCPLRSVCGVCVEGFGFMVWLFRRLELSFLC